MTHLAWVPRGLAGGGRARRSPASPSSIRRARSCSSRGRTTTTGSTWTRRCSASRSATESVCAEVIRVRLCGERARASRERRRRRCCRGPAGLLPLARAAARSTTCSTSSSDVVDRLIVDSTEWPSDTLAQGYGELAERFDRTVVSDIAWARTERWRRELAQRVAVRRRTSSRSRRRTRRRLLLAGWLRSRLGHDVEVEHEPAESLRVGVTSTGTRSTRRRASRRFRRICSRTSSSVHAQPRLRGRGRRRGYFFTILNFGFATTTGSAFDHAIARAPIGSFRLIPRTR